MGTDENEVDQLSSPISTRRKDQVEVASCKLVQK